jgi:hypothetical protein
MSSSQVVVLGYPDGIYQRIYLTALVLHPLHICTAFYYRFYMCGFMGIALYATSLNYWKYPRIDSFARPLDMVVAKSSILYHLYLAPSNSLPAWLIVAGSSCYLMSLVIDKINPLVAANLHCGLHVLVSLGATLLYRQTYAPC